MKPIWYKLVIAILLAFNVLLLYQNHQLKAEGSRQLVDSKMYVRQLQLPDVPVVDRDNHPASLLDLVKGNSHTMLVFFSPSDCPPCFSEKELWEQIPGRGNMPVYGIATSPDSRELWQWVENTEIPIEVYLDTTFAIEDLMEFQHTPLKVLVDSVGTVIWADPPREPGPTRESFWKELTNAME